MKYDISIAKNYLDKEELDKLNDLTNLFLDIAETEAKEHKNMTMNEMKALKLMKSCLDLD